MSAHTPSPWEAKCAKDGCGDIGIVGDCGVVAECFHDIRKFGENAHSECLANARLIAAAPELLEALKSIVTSLSDNDDEGMIEHSEQIIAARAAISKATGEPT